MGNKAASRHQGSKPSKMFGKQQAGVGSKWTVRQQVGNMAASAKLGA